VKDNKYILPGRYVLTKRAVAPEAVASRTVAERTVALGS